MSRPGPIGESLLRARKSLALHASVAQAIVSAFLEESDDGLPGTVVAALSRIDDGVAASSAQSGSSGADHWLSSRFFVDPVILSAATVRAARVIDGASGLGPSIGMPRRANDFPDVTPFGLGLFYEASLHHARKRGPSFSGVDRLFSDASVERTLREYSRAATLADALLLGLVPFAKSHLAISAQKGQVTQPDETSELALVSDLLAGLRQGTLPDVLPPIRLAADLLDRESFHGLLHAATRFGAVAKDKSGRWPELIAAYFPGGPARLSGSGGADVPLIVCALAATWLKASWRLLPPARKERFLSEFSSLVEGCSHEQAPGLASVLNRTIA